MKNIINLFKHDLSNIRKSVIGLIVMVGLVIVPVLYAWFNIAGSWDPYGNTGNIKVAVANSDEGYTSDLIPIKINMGDNVTSALRANDALDWVFVDEDAAIEGVKSGEYYAAVVIPQEFSADMMTLFSTEVKHSEIIYYENQKANAIAPRVTDKGASTVRQQIDETFTQTIGDIGLATSSSLLEFMDSDEVKNYVSNLSSTLDGGISSLRDAASAAGSFGGLMGSTSSLVSSAGGLLGTSGETSDRSQELLTDAKAGLASVQGALGDSADSINDALASVSGSFDDVSSAVDDVFDAAGTQSQDTQDQMNALADKVGTQASKIEAITADVEALKQKLPDNALKPLLEARLNDIITSLTSVSTKQRQLESRLRQAASDLASGLANAQQARADVIALIDEAKQTLSQVKDDYDETLKGQAEELKSSVENIASSASGISDNVDATVDSLKSASGSLAADLGKVQRVLTNTSSTLNASADDLQQMKAELDVAVQNGDLQKIRELIGNDPDALSEALAAPVGLDRHAVYHIKNYGSAMAPFYTILSLWVGGIVLAAMMKVGVDDSVKMQLVPVRLHELYLGRFMLFAMLSLLQSTLVCAGDILFFEIQCESPLLFLATGWLAGFVFCNIIYTLTVSFGDIGKALAVVLLVMQVAGSGGTFPIEMTADFFQMVYPFLPFTHGINAMHAAMAGSYGMEYWVEMGTLASYLIPSLALGLVFRRPVIRANNWIIEKLEETKLM